MSDASIPAEQVRERLLTEALRFILDAQRMPGVLRIALIGSITTPKLAPKDIDLLVTVVADIDLSALAEAARRLQGRCQGFNCGADIFLASAEQRYIGRTCPWKQCGFGIRAGCDALHCGRRPFLHDDTPVVRLGGDLVSSPPVELWPQLQQRVSLPSDVEQFLLHRLVSARPNAQHRAA